MFCILLYDFFETVDFFLGLDVPFFFRAFMLFTKEFFTPSLFFFAEPLFVDVLFATFLTAFLFVRVRDFFFNGDVLRTDDFFTGIQQEIR